MDDLISRKVTTNQGLSSIVQEIIDYLNTEVHPIVSPEHWDVYSTLYDMVARIDDKISSYEKRRGQWIIRDNPGTGWYRITCSECGEDVTSTAPCIGFFPNVKVIWDYCPDCGARMNLEDEEEE